MEEDAIITGLGRNKKEALIVLTTAPVSQDFSSENRKNRIDKLKQLIFYTRFNSEGKCFMGCVTAYSKKRLVTFAHGMHQNTKLGDIVFVFSIVDNSQFETKVIKRDHVRDFILLECDSEVCSFEFGRAAPSEGEKYIQLGLSATTQEISPLSISRGVFSSTHYNRSGHFLGSPAANPGDSGGGCFAEKCNTLFGINVGCDSVDISGKTPLSQLGTRYPARAHILPSIFFE